MKTKDDLVAGWLRKADSDLRTIGAAVSVGAFDTACFHAQQASEKVLKAFLIHSEIEFPFTHNLMKLANLCVARNSSLSPIISLVETLTPFAVELRYDAEFWPEKADAIDAQTRAESVTHLVRSTIGIS